MAPRNHKNGLYTHHGPESSSEELVASEEHDLIGRGRKWTENGADVTDQGICDTQNEMACGRFGRLCLVVAGLVFGAVLMGTLKAEGFDGVVYFSKITRMEGMQPLVPPGGMDVKSGDAEGVLTTNEKRDQEKNAVVVASSNNSSSGSVFDEEEMANEFKEEAHDDTNNDFNMTGVDDDYQSMATDQVQEAENDYDSYNNENDTEAFSEQTRPEEELTKETDTASKKNNTEKMENGEQMLLDNAEKNHLKNGTDEGKKKNSNDPEQSSKARREWEGVDMDRLNKCLRKHVFRRYWQQADQEEEENTSNVPLMDKTWSNHDHWWTGGDFGTLTTWTSSESKALRYLIIPKGGSMTFRWALSRCNVNKNIPCDVLNKYGRPWRPDNANMDFRRKGFYHHFYKGTTDTPEVPLQINVYFAKKVVDKTLPFTFVTDPIAHFIGGFVQYNKYKWPFKQDFGGNHDLKYQEEFRDFVKRFTEQSTRQEVWNIHFSPQLFHLYSAAMEAAAINKMRGDTNATFVPPVEFVGRLDKRYTEQDWHKLIDLIEERFPGHAKNIGRSVPHSNGSLEKPSKAKYHAALAYGKEHNLHSYARNYLWGAQHANGKKALGVYGHADTMPDELVKRFCATLYAEYFCLSMPFPPACTDEQGNYNLSDEEYPRFIEFDE